MTTNEPKNWNAAIIEEFRANQGRVGGPFAGRPMLILHTVGRKSGRERQNPLVYLRDGDRLLVFASKGGAPTHPDWYHNLKANGDVTVEVGTETVPMRANEVTGDERDTLFARQVEAMPQFGEYQKDNPRTIPVIALTRA
jgi:deazaflavin-dependent oxidoreductase (nitroreductase family)